MIEKHALNPDRTISPWFKPAGELGKTEARQSFLRLLNDLQDSIASLAITDRGKKVAVLMGYKQYEMLVSMIKQHSKPADKNPLAGLIKYTGDLEKTKRRVSKLFEESLKRKPG
jgi:PHD/YefM family antitoxin component YafN of YafNO toxin-antitoxin module